MCLLQIQHQKVFNKALLFFLLYRGQKSNMVFFPRVWLACRICWFGLRKKLNNNIVKINKLGSLFPLFGLLVGCLPHLGLDSYGGPRSLTQYSLRVPWTAGGAAPHDLPRHTHCTSLVCVFRTLLSNCFLCVILLRPHYPPLLVSRQTPAS